MLLQHTLASAAASDMGWCTSHPSRTAEDVPAVPNEDGVVRLELGYTVPLECADGVLAGIKKLSADIRHQCADQGQHARERIDNKSAVSAAGAAVRYSVVLYCATHGQRKHPSASGGNSGGGGNVPPTLANTRLLDTFSAGQRAIVSGLRHESIEFKTLQQGMFPMRQLGAQTVQLCIKLCKVPPPTTTTTTNHVNPPPPPPIM